MIPCKDSTQDIALIEDTEVEEEDTMVAPVEAMPPERNATIVGKSAIWHELAGHLAGDPKGRDLDLIETTAPQERPKATIFLGWMILVSEIPLVLVNLVNVFYRMGMK